MPRIIDYTRVVEVMRSGGFVSLYHNSGAWGFAQDVPTKSLGWIGPADDSIRLAARPLVRQVPPPFERNLAELAAAAWGRHFPGPVWVTPKSHWAYELNFGSREWMPDLLASIGVDPAALTPRNDGTALEFGESERAPFVRCVETLLGRLLGSDFALAFPGRPMVCTLHHHKQIWWTTSEEAVVAELEKLVSKDAGPSTER